MTAAPARVLRGDFQPDVDLFAEFNYAGWSDGKEFIPGYSHTQSRKIKYKGSLLGTVNVCNGNVYLAAYSNSDVLTLLKLNPYDIIEVGGRIVRFEVFREQLIERAQSLFVHSHGMLNNYSTSSNFVP